MEKPTASVPPLPSTQLQRQPSIDSEPKTLLENEMKLAREAALEVIKKHTHEEAQKIFLAGSELDAENSKKEKEDAVVTKFDDDRDGVKW